MFIDRASGNILPQNYFSTVSKESTGGEGTEFFFLVEKQEDPGSIGKYSVQGLVFLQNYPDVSILIQSPFQVTIEQQKLDESEKFEVEPEWLNALQD